MGVRVRRANATSGGFLAVSTAAVVVLAATAHGFSVQKLALNDGTVWITNDHSGDFGRFNRPIAQIDGGIDSGPADLDVRQNGQEVFAWDRSAGELTQVDPRNGGYDGGRVAVPSTFQVQLGGNTLATLSPDGKLRATQVAPQSGAGGVAVSQKPIVSNLPEGSTLAVGVDGTVYVASSTTLWSVRASGGVIAKPVKTPIGTTLTAPIEVSAVGDVPIVASSATGTLVFPTAHRAPVRIPNAANTQLELQAPSPPGDAIDVATAKQLVTVSLGAGTVTTISSAGTGAPAVPVRVGKCTQAAWGGTAGTYVRACDGQAPASPQSFATDDDQPPVFRVNNGEVVLNDPSDGRVWLVDSDHLQQVDPNWNQLRQAVKPHPGPHTGQHNPLPGRARPPKAVDDHLGARPGVPVVLHLLDNDSDPNGLPMAITALTAPNIASATLQVSPDAQTVVATVPQGTTSSLTFTYSITDGRNKAISTARVQVDPRSTDQNDKPRLRPRFQPPHLVVASTGSVTYPVLADWRDFDGDPLSLSLRSQPHGASASVNPQGFVTVNAGDRTGTVTVPYVVSDGVGSPVRGGLKLTVLSRHSRTTIRPKTRSDVATGHPGVPITISPLANDLPGADARNAAAQLALAGPVANQPGISVTTDTTDGTVTATATKPGTYFLHYVAAFGAAPVTHGLIRVDVTPAGQDARPVAVPDVVVLHGNTPSHVSVLDNDYDPNGNILIVDSALPANPNSGLQIATDHSEWVDIASSGASSPPRTVHYTLTDGTTEPVTGTIIVVQQPPLAFPVAPATRNDSVVVRAGSAATVDVLANDSDPDGGSLHLGSAKPKLQQPVPGLLVAPTGDDITVAASAHAKASSGVIDYVAENANGNTTVGHLQVRIQPQGGTDRRPEPLGIQLRATAGSPLIIHPQLTGIDPDGDATAITRIVQPPSMGRLVTVAPDTLTYQPFPTSGGTDSFRYEVVDPHGLSGVATIDIGVAPAAIPTPPLAIDHSVTASPGRTVHVNVLDGDAVTPGDHVVVVPLSRTNPSGVPRGTRLSGTTVSVPVPPQGAQPTVVGYGITDGSGQVSVGHVIVTGVRHVLLAPVALDDLYTGHLKPGQRSVVVPVLANDGDPDGSVADLRITPLNANSQVVKRRLQVTLSSQPQQVPYEITDRDGRYSIASVFVPAYAAVAPYLAPGAEAHLSSGGSATVKLAKIVVDPNRRTVKLGPLDQISVAPTEPTAIATSAQSSRMLTVQSISHYVGPADVTFVVYDGKTLEDPRGTTATLTLPVQIGPYVPILACPRTPIVITAGNPALAYNIPSLCHVWTDPAHNQRIHFTAHAEPSIGGVNVSARNGDTLAISSKSSSDGGRTSVVIGGGGARPDRIPLRVIPLPHTSPSKSPPKGGKKNKTPTTPPSQPPAPLPVFGSVPTITLEANGQPVSVDLAPDLQSPLPDATPDVVAATVPADSGVVVTHEGSTITLTAAQGGGAQALAVDVVMTDEPNHPERDVAGVIAVQVVGVPGQPTITAADSVGDKTIQLTWTTPADNGRPIINYVARSAQMTDQNCSASPCTITVPQNFTTYQFQVAAVNAVGTGKFSEPSSPVEAHPLPGPFAVTSVKPGDRTIDLAWSAADAHGGSVEYTVQGDNGAGSKGPMAATAVTFSNLTNGNDYTFTINACVQDIYCTQESSGAPVTPYGKPFRMSAPSAHGAPTAPAASQAITVSWAAVTNADDNGSAVDSYTVTELSGTSASGPWATVDSATTTATGQSFTVRNDGTYYVYTVTAHNAAGDSDPSPDSSAVQGAAPPDQMATPSATDHQANGTGLNHSIQVTFTDPAPNAGGLTTINYALNGATQKSGSWDAKTKGTTQTESVSGLTNGQTYTVAVQACNDAGMCGAWSGSSASVSPYTTPGAANASASVNGQTITFNWSGGGGGGRAIDHYHVCIDGGVGCSDHTAAGSISHKFSDYSTTHTETVTVVDTAGQSSTAATASATTKAAPTLSVSEGGPGSDSSYCANGCHYIFVSMTNWDPSTRYTIWFSTDCGGTASPHYAKCASQGGTTDYNSATITTDASGSVSANTRLYGYSGDHVYVTVNGQNSNTITWS